MQIEGELNQLKTAKELEMKKVTDKYSEEI